MGKEKRPNLNWARNMDIDAWRDRQVSKRLKARIAKSNQDFAEAHKDDTDEQLREYVRQKAASLRRMPHPLELSGGIYLSKRLGDWRQLASQLGFLPVGSERGRRAYRFLREREAELFAQERRAAKAEKRKLAAQNRNSVPTGKH